MSTIITKNSSTASAVPLAGDLVKGELAVNVTDKKLYTKDNSANIVKVVGSLGNQEANAVAITGGAIADVTLAMGTNKITGVGDPTSNQDAATKKYVDDRDALELSLTGGTMSGSIAMGTNKITDLGTPTANADAATKLYVDTADALKLSLAGGTMSGAIAMGSNKITGLGTPTADADATTKIYVDGILGSATAAAASATAAAASLDSFDDRYLGPKTVDPTVDNDGNALLTGALYWNSVGSIMKVYTGTAWVTFNPVNNPVDQTDIGTAPNEIPLNQYLGNLAYQDAANIAGPVRVGSALTVVGATTLAAATVTGAVEVGGGIVAEQLVVDNFTASSNAVLRGGATNLLTYSEQFDDATWSKSNATITANTIVSPDGTLGADKLVEDTAATTTHFVSRNANVTFTAVAHTWSVYLKAGERTWVRLTLLDGATTFGAYFNLSTGALGAIAAGTTATVTPVGNGWYRCSVTATTAATASGSARILLANADNGQTYTGDGTSGIFIWGAQLNTGSSPAAYLKTVATAVTTAYAAPIESPNGLAFPLLSTMTPARNADMTFELASNTSLVVKVRGSDGTVRSVTLTLA